MFAGKDFQVGICNLYILHHYICIICYSMLADMERRLNFSVVSRWKTTDKSMLTTRGRKSRTSCILAYGQLSSSDTMSISYR